MCFARDIEIKYVLRAMIHDFGKIPFFFPPIDREPICVRWESIVQQVFTLDLRGAYMLSCFRIGYSEDIKLLTSRRVVKL